MRGLEGTIKNTRFFRGTSRPAYRTYVFIAIGCTWLLIGFLLYNKLADKTILRTRSYNAAIAETLNADIANLPRVDSITPSRTSLNMAYVAQSRSDLSKKLYTGSYNAHPVPMWCRFYPGASRAYAGKTQDLLARQLADHLRSDGETIASLRKFVEYMPTVDLAGPLDNSAITQEHLARTKQGLLATSQVIEGIRSPQSSVIATAVTKLGNEAPTLTDTSKNTWSQNIATQQIAVLTLLAHNDIQASPYARQLAEISNDYQ